MNAKDGTARRERAGRRLIFMLGAYILGADAQAAVNDAAGRQIGVGRRL
jgi:hypothetical protein